MEGRGGDPRRGRRDHDDDRREQWRPDRSGAPYGDLELNARNRGVEAYGVPHDYAYHPQQGHEFDPDYLHWREEQMRAHDRDYHEWRQAQRDGYDEDYRRFRTERRDHFGRTFHEWRSQKSRVGGGKTPGVASGISGYGEISAIPGGYTGGGADKPSGMLEPRHGLTGDAAMTQTGGQRSEGGAASAGGGNTSPEFGREPRQVQAATDGSDSRGRPEDRDDSDGDARDGETPRH